MDDSRVKKDWQPKPRSHPLAVRIDEDLYKRLRREAQTSRMSLSAVVRLALDVGVERVEADRVERSITGG